MYGKEILVVSVLVSFSCATNSSLFPNWQSSWIFGGAQPVAGSYRFMVSVRNVYTDKLICGGTIVHNRYILTAAHCVEGRRPGTMVVFVGTNRSTNRGLGRKAGEKFRILSYIKHHAYNPSTRKNDIALIKLTRSISEYRYNTNRVVRLASQDEETAPGTRCLFMGWGKTSPSKQTYSKLLQSVELRVISVSECLQSYPDVSDSYICANAGPGKATSMGDDGGPLLCNDKQVGVYVGGTPGPRVSTPLPSVFISVAKFSDWIQEHSV